MSIEIRSTTLGIAATNAYLVGDPTSKEAILIDPVDDADSLLQMAEEAGWEIKLILATHAHFDHVLASKPLKERTNAPFYIHEECVLWLESLPERGHLFIGEPFPEPATPDRLLLSTPETIELGEIRLETLYTPGHAPGHLSFYMPQEKVLFSGDTLFAGSIGRTDLPGSNHALLMDSIFNKILPLGDDVTVLPGHMQPTTIGAERNTNPFLLMV